MLPGIDNQVPVPGQEQRYSTHIRTSFADQRPEPQVVGNLHDRWWLSRKDGLLGASRATVTALDWDEGSSKVPCLKHWSLGI